MILLTLIASALIVIMTIYQFREQSLSYHQERLLHKETAIHEHIDYVLRTTTYPLSTENLSIIFRDRIHELATIHNLEIVLYDLHGNFIRTSKGQFTIDTISNNIDPFIIKALENSHNKRYTEIKNVDNIKHLSSYSYIKDLKFKPLGIVCLPYIEDDNFYEKELYNFLLKLLKVYGVMLIIAIILAYFLSNYITKTLYTVSRKIMKTNLHQKNEKIRVKKASKEIMYVIDAYNLMVEKLEESAVQLAQSQREEAWREMAKQVAHEIKNPLTPMRLTVQNFARKFDPDAPNIRQKLNDYSETLIQQIDTMSAVASAFSNFASMPAQQNESLNIVSAVELSLEIFNKNYITFHCSEKEIILMMDRTQLIRIITNLVKNAIQATEDHTDNPLISVGIKRLNNVVLITVQDNGKGIVEGDRSRIFEPKFTTKTSGMGLGLGIIKNIIESYNGKIWFETQVEKGTTFYVELPIVQ
ncbi:MAG: ATP-binding protein [Bacteroidota bacterium]|nr:ATP-binding protein [Bacteroidota bacterium]